MLTGKLVVTLTENIKEKYFVYYLFKQNTIATEKTEEILLIIFMRMKTNYWNYYEIYRQTLIIHDNM